MRSDINRTKTSETLRTSGRLTGNFGRNRVVIGDSHQVSKKTLTLDEIKIVDPKEYYTRICLAYKQTNDPKLKRTLLNIIKSRAATIRRRITPD